MSEFNPLARVGPGPGLLAALVGPNGAEEGLIDEVMSTVCKPSDGGFVGDCGVGALSADVVVAVGSEFDCTIVFEDWGEEGCWGDELSMATKG